VSPNSLNNRGDFTTWAGIFRDGQWVTLFAFTNTYGGGQVNGIDERGVAFGFESAWEFAEAFVYDGELTPLVLPPIEGEPLNFRPYAKRNSTLYGVASPFPTPQPVGSPVACGSNLTCDHLPMRVRGSSVLWMQHFGGDAWPRSVSRQNRPVGYARVAPRSLTWAAVWWDADGAVHRFPADPVHSAARAVNDWGITAGEAGPQPLPMLWDFQGHVAGLALPVGATGGAVTALNNVWEFAGAVSFGGAGSFWAMPLTAVVWAWWTDWQPIALADLVSAPGWTFERVAGLNDAGALVGWGTFNGVPHG